MLSRISAYSGTSGNVKKNLLFVISLWLLNEGDVLRFSDWSIISVNSLNAAYPQTTLCSYSSKFFRLFERRIPEFQIYFYF